MGSRDTSDLDSSYSEVKFQEKSTPRLLTQTQILGTA